MTTRFTSYTNADNIADYVEANRLLQSLQEVKDAVVQNIDESYNAQEVKEKVVLQWWSRVGEAAWNKAIGTHDPTLEYDIDEARIMLSSDIDAILPGAWEIVSSQWTS